MANKKYKNFSLRLINAMIAKGHIASRSPSGICMKSLSEFANASEQICRRYIRGEALPDYEKIINLAKQLDISPGWLLFGEEQINLSKNRELEEHLLHYILKHSHCLYPVSKNGNSDYADFVLGLFKEVYSIETSQDNLLKIIDIAISSISMFDDKNKKYNYAV